MAIYTVHVPRGQEDRIARADRTAFIRDGFNFWAFLFGPLFLLRHRAWAAVAAWIVLVVAVAWLAHVVHLPVGIRLLLLLLLELFLGFEGNDLRRMALEGRGFDFAEVVVGSREASEHRFFETHAETAPLAAPRGAPMPPRGRPPASSQDVIGSFPIQGA